MRGDSRGKSREKNQSGLPGTAGGGWRSNGGKVQCVKQGSSGLARSGAQVERCNIRAETEEPQNPEPDDRVFVVAVKRVMIVERRDTGKVEA